MKEDGKDLRELVEERIDEFMKIHGREPGACEVREIELEVEKEK